MAVHFNSHIASVSFDDEKQLPSITLADGSIHYADLVVGADGYHSVVRDAVTGEPDRGTDSGNTFFSYVQPTNCLLLHAVDSFSRKNCYPRRKDES